MILHRIHQLESSCGPAGMCGRQASCGDHYCANHPLHAYATESSESEPSYWSLFVGLFLIVVAIIAAILSAVKSLPPA
jgi:hypothetical protein